MRDQQSSDTSIALDANTDVSIVTMTHNYNLVFPTAIVIALCAGASVLTIKRIK